MTESGKLPILVLISGSGSNLQPLNSLTSATSRLAAGDFRHRVALASGDEFQQLGDAFDAMAWRIGTQFDQLQTLALLDRDR